MAWLMTCTGFRPVMVDGAIPECYEVTDVGSHPSVGVDDSQRRYIIDDVRAKYAAAQASRAGAQAAGGGAVPASSAPAPVSRGPEAVVALIALCLVALAALGALVALVA